MRQRNLRANIGFNLSIRATFRTIDPGLRRFTQGNAVTVDDVAL
jgi:hypothetical protein